MNNPSDFIAKVDAYILAAGHWLLTPTTWYFDPALPVSARSEDRANFNQTMAVLERTKIQAWQAAIEAGTAVQHSAADEIVGRLKHPEPTKEWLTEFKTAWLTEQKALLSAARAGNSPSQIAEKRVAPKLSPSAQKLWKYLEPQPSVPTFDVMENELEMARKTISKALRELDAAGKSLNRHRKSRGTKRKPSRKL